MTRTLLRGLILFLIACSPDKLGYRDIIGKNYNSLGELKQFKKFKEVGGTLVQDGDEIQYTVSRLEKDLLNVLVLEKKQRQGDGKSNYKALDILELNGIDDKKIIEVGMCRQSGTVDYKIIGLCDYEEKEILSKILKAWRVNTQQEKFEEISVDGVDCINISYGND